MQKKTYQPRKVSIKGILLQMLEKIHSPTTSELDKARLMRDFILLGANLVRNIIEKKYKWAKLHEENQIERWEERDPKSYEYGDCAGTFQWWRKFFMQNSKIHLGEIKHEDFESAQLFDPNEFFKRFYYEFVGDSRINKETIIMAINKIHGEDMGEFMQDVIRPTFDLILKALLDKKILTLDEIVEIPADVELPEPEKEPESEETEKEEPRPRKPKVDFATGEPLEEEEEVTA